MRGKFEFREPLSMEPDGTYITAGQMQFYLNRREGETNFKKGSPDFMKYYKLCRIYNVMYDIMEEDESAAIMFWNPEKDGISVSFPEDGEVAFALADIDAEDAEDGGEEDTWSSGVS